MNLNLKHIFNSVGIDRKNLLSATLVLVLITSMFLPLQLMPLQGSAAAPTTGSSGVDGRILSASYTGDSSDWIEIARNGDYSLIVRRNVLPEDPVNFPISGNDNDYRTSNVRNVVNNWFKVTLNPNARLRAYTMKSDALDTLGTWGSTFTFSTPETVASTGDDVAFLLSFGEAATFCSLRYGTTFGSWTASSQLAQNNFNKLNSPPQRDFWWLRTPGRNTVSVSSVGSHSVGLAGCVYGSSSSAEGSYVYVRPALWVKSSIFDVEYTVHYYLEGTTTKVADSKTVTGSVDSSITENAISIAGYTALEPVSLTKTLTASSNEFVFYYVANDGVKYVVEHYDATSGAVLQSQSLTGITGTVVTASAGTFAGYTYDPADGRNVVSGTIAGDGSLVLKLYYSRNTDIVYVVHYYSSSTFC